MTVLVAMMGGLTVASFFSGFDLSVFAAFLIYLHEKGNPH